MVTERQPRPGDIAICSLGHIGIVGDGHPRNIRYSNGKKGKAFVGKAIFPPHRFGKPWSSRKPTILGNVADLQLTG